MSNKICVYTCITGNYDNLHEIENREPEIDYFCFTNNKNLKSKTWQIIQIKNNGLSDRRLARKTKILGHPKINSYDICVWIDADVIWKKSIKDFVDCYFQKTSLSIFKHHARNTIREEALACLTFRKEKYEALTKVLDFYKSVNYLDQNGLCESTVYIKNPKDPKVLDTMTVWYNMIENYTERDQLSFNYAIWKTKLLPTYIDLNVWDNPWFSTSKHTQKQNISDCIIYYGKTNTDPDLKDYTVHRYQKQNNNYSVQINIPYNTNVININPFNSIGVYFEITSEPSATDTKVIGSSPYKTGFVSCTEYNLIQLFGNFKKGQTILFAITTHNLNDLVLHETFDSLWRTNHELISENGRLALDNRSLKKANTKLQKDLHSILNSKGWKALERLRKIIPNHP